MSHFLTFLKNMKQNQAISATVNCTIFRATHNTFSKLHTYSIWLFCQLSWIVISDHILPWKVDSHYFFSEVIFRTFLVSVKSLFSSYRLDLIFIAERANDCPTWHLLLSDNCRGLPWKREPNKWHFVTFQADLDFQVFER